jgi:hypothetical protein
MTTLEKLNKIANKLFKVNYIKLSKTNENEVFAHFLAKYAVSVQPKSRNYKRYLEIKGKNIKYGCE